MEKPQNLPNHFLLLFFGKGSPCHPLLLQGCRLLAIVRVHHHVSLGVLLDAQVGAQQGAQGSQEAARVLKQLFWGHQHHDDQHALRQVLGSVSSTVQPVPATLLAVAALVTVVVFEVVRAVFVIPGRGGGEEEGTGTEAHTALELCLLLLGDWVPLGSLLSALGPKYPASLLWLL